MSGYERSRQAIKATLGLDIADSAQAQTFERLIKADTLYIIRLRKINSEKSKLKRFWLRLKWGIFR